MVEAIAGAIITLQLPPVGGIGGGSINEEPERRYAQEDGPEEVTAPDGRVIYRCYWRANVRDGLASFYHEGRLVHEISFVKGRRNGVERVYNVFGRRIYESSWSNDELNGVVLWYSDDGKTLLFENSFKNGRQLFYSFKNGGSAAVASRSIDIKSSYNHSMVRRLVCEVVEENTQAMISETRTRSVSSDMLRRRANTGCSTNGSSSSLNTSQSSLSPFAKMQTHGPIQSSSGEEDDSSSSDRYRTRTKSLSKISGSIILGKLGNGSAGSRKNSSSSLVHSSWTAASPTPPPSPPPPPPPPPPPAHDSQTDKSLEEARDKLGTLEKERVTAMDTTSLADYYTLTNESTARASAREGRFSGSTSPTGALTPRSRTGSDSRSTSPRAVARAAMLQLIVADPNDSVVMRILHEDEPSDGGFEEIEQDEPDPILAAISQTNKSHRTPTNRLKLLVAGKKDKRKPKKEKEKKSK